MYILKKANGSKSPVQLHNTDTGEITTIGILTPQLKQGLIDLGMEHTNHGTIRMSVNDPRRMGLSSIDPHGILNLWTHRGYEQKD